MFRAIEQSDSDDGLDEVEPDEDPPEARDRDLAPLLDTNVTTYSQGESQVLARKKYVRNDKFSLCRLLVDKLVAVPSIESVYPWDAID